jgi:hypothetical protein
MNREDPLPQAAQVRSDVSSSECGGTCDEARHEGAGCGSRPGRPHGEHLQDLICAESSRNAAHLDALVSEAPALVDAAVRERA